MNAPVTLSPRATAGAVEAEAGEGAPKLALPGGGIAGAMALDEWELFTTAEWEAAAQYALDTGDLSEWEWMLAEAREHNRFGRWSYATQRDLSFEEWRALA